MTRENTSESNLLDHLTKQRLAKLRSRPMDTASLETWFDRACEQPATIKPAASYWRRWRTLSAAAVLALAALVGLMSMMFSGAPATAAPVDLANFHHATLEGDHELVPVEDLVEANRALREHAYEGPDLPERLASPVVGCCVHLLDGRPIGTVLVQWEGEPVSIMTARSAEVQPPDGRAMQHADRTYRVQRRGDIHVVIHQRGDQWVGAIGAHDATALARLLNEGTQAAPAP